MLEIWTIGHSTRTLDEFIALLVQQDIKLLADIRTVPFSRHNPQFGQDLLPASLNDAGIRYLHLKGLGGLRKKARESVSLGWRNQSFRNFADYMQTPDFEAALLDLIALAEKERTCIMCAEAVPWRCHRSLVGDALMVRGVQVHDIISHTAVKDHELTSFAVLSGNRVTYPLPEEEPPA